LTRWIRVPRLRVAFFLGLPVLAPAGAAGQGTSPAGVTSASDDAPVVACSNPLPETIRAKWIPSRPAGAPTGSQFAARTRGRTGQYRQRQALAELRRGNMPEFLRALKPVRLEHRTDDGRLHTAVVWVMPDYLSIGSNEDYVRVPLTRPTAVTIAADLGFVLPTRKIVDAVYDQADYRITPRPLPASPTMRSTEYYLRHNALIERALDGHVPGALLAGHKKDLVLTNRLRGKERVAIYGWHRDNGDPIQELSTYHGAGYADYSHGVRLVYAVVCVDGEPRSAFDVLEDPDLAPLLTYEGLLPRVRKLMRW
jgi:hypothetical protein